MFLACYSRAPYLTHVTCKRKIFSAFPSAANGARSSSRLCRSRHDSQIEPGRDPKRLRSNSRNHDGPAVIRSHKPREAKAIVGKSVLELAWSSFGFLPGSSGKHGITSEYRRLKAHSWLGK
ncbi:hypothetical protein ACU8KH_05139 [Lachancea thermotolerans]